MVIRLVLPEYLSRSSQNPIRITGTNALNSTHNPAQWEARCNEQVNMVWHDDVRSQKILRQGFLTANHRVLDAPCNSAVHQPPRADFRAVRLQIESLKPRSSRLTFFILVSLSTFRALRGRSTVRSDR